MKAKRKPGISFVVRCRNEEKYIANCIISLKELKVPHEIIVVLHQCTDGSRQIVEGLKQQGYPIQIVEYDHQLSRAGYENLITPADHPASLVTYYDFCFGHARYNWIMKWDADFVCSPELLSYLNHQLKLDETSPTCVRIGCQLGEDGPVNAELYLTNALLGFSKYIFWEIPNHIRDYHEIRLDDALIQSISSKILKNYWSDSPWFLYPKTHDHKLEDKYKKLVEILGLEPVGLARASNEECDDIFRAVLLNENLLKSTGINLYS